MCNVARSNTASSGRPRPGERNGIALIGGEPGRTHGSSLTNLAGYRIYYGNASTALNKQIELNSANLTSAMIENLAAGTWYFAIASRNTDNIVSDRSTIISARVLN